jgi:hypothetical protein
MKKILFAIAIVMMLGMTANAQRDGFFSDYDNYDGERATSGFTPSVPGGDPGIVGDVTADPVPVGTGLLIMTALGAGYAVARKRRK